MTKMRITIGGFQSEERDKAIDLVVHTKMPEKWIFVDTEHIGIWAYSGINEKGKMFRKACLEEILESQIVIRKILEEVYGIKED